MINIDSVNRAEDVWGLCVDGMSGQDPLRKIELTAEELMLSRAQLSYAIDLCSVEGIYTNDGRANDRSYYQSLLGKLKAVQTQPVNVVELTEEDLKFLSAAAQFCIDYCPVEGGIVMEDGQSTTRESVVAYREKLENILR
jgi:hypothetical protein